VETCTAVCKGMHGNLVLGGAHTLLALHQSRVGQHIATRQIIGASFDLGLCDQVGDRRSLDIIICKGSVLLAA